MNKQENDTERGWVRHCPKCGKLLKCCSKRYASIATNACIMCKSCSNRERKAKNFDNDRHHPERWMRHCPKCKKELRYSIYDNWKKATNGDWLCRSCIRIGMKPSKKTRMMWSLHRTGKNNHIENQKHEKDITSLDITTNSRWSQSN